MGVSESQVRRLLRWAGVPATPNEKVARNAELIRLNVEERMSAREIAERVGLNRYTVMSIFRRLGHRSTVTSIEARRRRGTSRASAGRIAVGKNAADAA